MQKHEHFEELTALAAIGQLSAEEHRELLEHLRGCDGCGSWSRTKTCNSWRAPAIGRDSWIEPLPKACVLPPKRLVRRDGESQLRSSETGVPMPSVPPLPSQS